MDSSYSSIPNTGEIPQSNNNDHNYSYSFHAENKVSIRLGLVCLLNNTYSLLDYVIVSSEKTQLKKLLIKAKVISLKKIEMELKSLFPNLQVTYAK